MVKKILFCVFCLISIPGYAVKVTDLYQVELAVHSQSASERKKALQQGFKQVLVKLSGDAKILQNPKVKPYLAKAEDFVEEYAYDHAQNTSQGDEFIVKVRYNAEDIDQMLSLSKASTWGEDRPLTLVWLAITDKDGRTEVIGNDKPVRLLSDMKYFSQQYGLPLIFPMMDMKDMDKVSADEVVSMDVPELKYASMRYAPDVLLLGHITAKGDEFQSEWRLIANSTQWNWGLKTASKEQAVTQVFSQVEETLARHYVVTAETSETSASGEKLRLKISNVNQSEDLLHLVNYLKELKSLRDVELIQISGNSVELSARLKGSLETLQQNTSLSRRMVLKSQAANNVLYYEWVT